jgi:hypothetical protein
VAQTYSRVRTLVRERFPELPRNGLRNPRSARASPIPVVETMVSRLASLEIELSGGLMVWRIVLTDGRFIYSWAALRAE